ncbi:hypothetical protein [Krasilnikovia sp. MM14-A1004]|uniref:hypothetical protein n=1 Tax=Krasilnikovia sp. MM14-A1004 TaxID=3373541 RepID=UPI00399CBD5C
MAAVAAVTLGGGAAAHAAPKQPVEGGAADCQPETRITVSGNKITYNAFTRCKNLVAFELQMGYFDEKGKTAYSGIHYCRGPLQGDSFDAMFECGVSGIRKTVTDNRSGSQSWCMNTFMTKFTPVTGSKPGKTGAKDTSLLRCIKH